MSNTFKTDWDYNDVISAEDMNRIEVNAQDHEGRIAAAENTIADHTDSIEAVVNKLTTVDEIYYVQGQFVVDQGYNVDIANAEVHVNVPKRFNMSNTMIAGIMIHGYQEIFKYNKREHNIEAWFGDGGSDNNQLILNIDNIKSRKTYYVRAILVNKPSNN